MAEEEQKQEPEEVKEEPKEEVAEEKIHKTEVKVDMSAVTEALNSLRAEVVEMKKVREQETPPADKTAEEEKPEETPAAEPADETKGVVATEPEAEAEETVDESMVCEKAETGKGFQIYTDFSKDTSGKFKRLIR